jgi:hypothetical protein
MKLCAFAEDTELCKFMKKLKVHLYEIFDLCVSDGTADVADVIYINM